MSNTLEKKSQDLEQKLTQQIQLLQKDSKDWLKVSGIVLAAGLVTYGMIQVTKKKKDNKTKQAIDILAKEGLLTKEIEAKLQKTSKSTFWPALTQKLLVLGLAIAKEKFFIDLISRPSERADEQEKKV